METNLVVSYGFWPVKMNEVGPRSVTLVVVIWHKTQKLGVRNYTFLCLTEENFVKKLIMVVVILFPK